MLIFNINHRRNLGTDQAVPRFPGGRTTESQAKRGTCIQPASPTENHIL